HCSFQRGQAKAHSCSGGFPIRPRSHVQAITVCLNPLRVRTILSRLDLAEQGRERQQVNGRGRVSFNQLLNSRSLWRGSNLAGKGQYGTSERGPSRSERSCGYQKNALSNG